MIHPEKAKKLLRKRLLLSSPMALSSLFDPAFPQQKTFVEDTAKLKALFCTRRAAKSYTAGLYLIHEALANPGCNLLFIGLTRASSKGIIWKDILKVLNKRHKLKAVFNSTELTMTFPNGSVIAVTGANADDDEMNKLLGRKYRLVCIDEASMYTISLSNLVYGVLKPAMVDPSSSGDRGTICLMGTSSNFTRGLFFDITTGKEQGWSLHTWSAHNNPYVATQWQEELEEIETKRPLYKETPQYKQWYLNKWVVDDDKLVYKFNELKNLYTKIPHLPPDGWTYVLGVDTGWEDDNAFVLTGYHQNDPTLYVIKTFNKPKMTFEEVVTKCYDFIKDPQYSPSKIIIDGANKQGVESMKQRSSIPFEFADKSDKATFIELLNSDLIQAKIKFSNDCSGLVDEMMSLVWKTDGNDRIALPKREHPSLPNHLCDAFLYAWRKGYHYHSTDAVPTSVIGSREWFDKQAEDIWEREKELLIAQNSNGWPDDGGWGSL